MTTKDAAFRRARRFVQKFQRSLNAANRRFGEDRCHGCRRKLNSLDMLLVGITATGATRVVGACCSDRLALIANYGLRVAHDEDLDRVAEAMGDIDRLLGEPAGTA